jgi:tellurite resistance protein TerC
MNELPFLLLFILLVCGMLGVDLGIHGKNEHTITFKEAAVWTAIWIGIALLFYLFIYFHAEWIHGIKTMDDLQAINNRHGHRLAFDLAAPFAENLKLYRHTVSLEYLTGYFIEKSLSIDNIFVMLMLFISFKVERKYFHRVLFYGILGAIVMRFLFIFTASALIQRFQWALLLFGVILIFTGIKLFFKKKEKSIDSEHHPVVRFLSKRHLVTPQFHGHDFFHRIDGRLLCTPLFVTLIVIEFSDIIFAFDSIPSIFSVTQDPYIVFFSNIFAILGLRSLFFMLESIMDKFRYLHIGLAVLLLFVGSKMLLPYLFHVHIPTLLSLVIILGIIAVSILTSLLVPQKNEANKI